MNTFKKIMNTIIMLAFMTFSAQVFAVSTDEDAIETESLRITINPDGTGFVQGKICDDCKKLTVPISPETRAFSKGVEVPLSKAASRLGKSATVYINTEHTKVMRISW